MKETKETFIFCAVTEMNLQKPTEGGRAAVPGKVQKKGKKKEKGGNGSFFSLHLGAVHRRKKKGWVVPAEELGEKKEGKDDELMYSDETSRLKKHGTPHYKEQEKVGREGGRERTSTRLSLHGKGTKGQAICWPTGAKKRKRKKKRRVP